MKITYGFEIYTKDQTVRLSKSGFLKKDVAVEVARWELKARTDSHAIILSKHYSAGKLTEIRHLSRITAKNGE